jgi:hypothetical protein
MSLHELFNGIAVIVDDEINDSGKNINQIIKQLTDKNIPLVKYESLPNIKIIDHLQNISFLLFDWQLFEKMPGIDIPKDVQDQYDIDNIKFLSEFSKKCFCPVFLFTNGDIDSIETKLSNEGLYFNDKPNRIFIKHKSELTTNTKLFSEIEKWLSETSSMYVLKKWQFEYGKAINGFFNDFQGYSPNWPLVMWKTYNDDGADESLEIGDLLTRNVSTRMSPFNFDKEILSKEYSGVVKTDIQSILQGERYIESKNLNPDDISPGDLFKEEGNDGISRYFLNIRAHCDLLRDSNPEIYCLRGRKIDESKINVHENYKINDGQFMEKSNNAIIPFIDERCIIEFLFKDLKVMKWNTKKNFRIGRLLSPYINKIQQKYASYLERQGLSRMPEEAIPTPRPEKENGHP